MTEKTAYISEESIIGLGISPMTCVEWVKDSFCMKYESQLPAKMSVHPKGNDFITSMPALLPPEMGRFSIKIVSRIKGRKPALKSEIFLYDSNSGELIAILDGDWITTIRTGAVAALAASVFADRIARKLL